MNEAKIERLLVAVEKAKDAMRDAGKPLKMIR